MVRVTGGLHAWRPHTAKRDRWIARGPPMACRASFALCTHVRLEASHSLMVRGLARKHAMAKPIDSLPAPHAPSCRRPAENRLVRHIDRDLLTVSRSKNRLFRRVQQHHTRFQSRATYSTLRLNMYGLISYILAKQIPFPLGRVLAFAFCLSWARVRVRGTRVRVVVC